LNVVVNAQFKLSLVPCCENKHRIAFLLNASQRKAR